MAACAAKFGGSHQGVAGLAELWRGDGELNLHEGLRWLKKKLKKEDEKSPRQSADRLGLDQLAQMINK
jgi:hypothetical protein